MPNLRGDAAGKFFVVVVFFFFLIFVAPFRNLVEVWLDSFKKIITLRPFKA